VRTLLAIIFMTFATQASAEIIMQCKYKKVTPSWVQGIVNNDITLKLVSSLFGKDKILYRSEGAWKDWCEERNELNTVNMHEINYQTRFISKLQLGDQGAKCMLSSTPTNSAHKNFVGYEEDTIVDFYFKHMSEM